MEIHVRGNLILAENDGAIQDSVVIALRDVEAAVNGFDNTFLTNNTGLGIVERSLLQMFALSGK